MRKETEVILSDNFNAEEIKMLKIFSKITETQYQNKLEHDVIWKYDQSLSGLGGYAFPLDPKMNPCNEYKEYRNVFRSLQYARCDMYNSLRGRFVINDSGLHVETLIKLINDKYSIISFFNNRKNLGVNLSNIEKKKIVSDELSEKIRNLINIYNISKHDTDEKANITFDIVDGIVFYFACRKIGNELLEILNHYSVGKYYNINDIDDWKMLGYTGDTCEKNEVGRPMMDLTEIDL